MKSRFLIILLIVSMGLISMPFESNAASKYRYNTYKEGYEFMKRLGLDIGNNWGQDLIFSPSTGQPDLSRAKKFCAPLKSSGDKRLLFGPNAINGCAGYLMTLKY